MLTQCRTYLGYHLQAAGRSVRFLLHKPWATLMTVLVIAFAFTLPALFWVFSENVQTLSGDVQRGGHISLYLDSSMPQDESALLERVPATPGVVEATLRSPEDGLAELQKQEGMQDIMQYLPENPLPAVIDVIPAATVNTVEQSNELYQLLKAYPHVEQARFDMQWVSRFYTLRDIAAKIATAVMVLLASVVVILVANSLRISMQHRHEETQVLSFIGASNSYIIRPFLYLGIFYGVAGGLVAMVLVQILIISLSSLMSPLAEAYGIHFVFTGLSLEHALFLLMSAMTLGWVGARLSVSSLRRFGLKPL